MTDWMFPNALRYFECIVPAANTAKWWAYKVDSDVAVPPLDGVRVVVRWGRIGAAGDSDPKIFPSAMAAQRFVEDKVKEKLRKGYVAREEDWARRTWAGTRPPFAVDRLPRGEELRKLVQPKPLILPKVDPEQLYSNLRARINPGRLKPREPVPARAAKRVIDFTEEG